MDAWPYKVSSMTRDEIMRSIQDDGWQLFRRGLKGESTRDKLWFLHMYRDKNTPRNGTVTREAQVRVDNYINALLRGGQLKQRQNGVIVVNR